MHTIRKSFIWGHSKINQEILGTQSIPRAHANAELSLKYISFLRSTASKIFFGKVLAVIFDNSSCPINSVRSRLVRAFGSPLENRTWFFKTNRSIFTSLPLAKKTYYLLNI